MSWRLLKSERGISLVEVLATLVIIGIFSVIILNYMINGLNNYSRINEKIALQDEANYVMQLFINHIYETTRVEVEETNDTTWLIRTKNYEGTETVLGFKNGQALLNGAPVHADKYSVHKDSSIKLAGEKTVEIKLVLEDKKSGQSLTLENSVAYLKASGGEKDEE